MKFDMVGKEKLMELEMIAFVGFVVRCITKKNTWDIFGMKFVFVGRRK